MRGRTAAEGFTSDTSTVSSWPICGEPELMGCREAVMVPALASVPDGVSWPGEFCRNPTGLAHHHTTVKPLQNNLECQSS